MAPRNNQRRKNKQARKQARAKAKAKAQSVKSQNKKKQTPQSQKSAQDLIQKYLPSAQESQQSSNKMSGTQAAAKTAARAETQRQNQQNQAALKNDHTPAANPTVDSKPQPGTVTYESRNELPSYQAGDISHHKKRTNETNEEWAAYMKTDRGRIEQQEKWLNPEYRAQREAQDGKKYTATGTVKRDDSAYREALLGAKGQEALDKYDALMDPDKRYKEAAASAADARQRYEFTASGGAGGEAGRARRQQEKFNGGSPFADQLKLINSNIKVKTNKVYSPKTGQLETVNTYENPEMFREATIAQQDAWKDYITYGKNPDFSGLINKYGMTKGDNFDAAPGPNSGKAMGHVGPDGKTHYAPQGLTPNQNYEKMMEARRSNPQFAERIDAENWFAYI